MNEDIKRTVISISLFGESNVGKTCICGVFLGLEFEAEHLSTVGIEKMISVIKIETGETIKLKLWDTAGQERFHCISLNSLKNSQAAIVVFDLTNKESFEKVPFWLKQIRDYSTKVPIALFGNKSDLKKVEINQEEINKLCEIEDIVYFKTSAKENIGIIDGFTKIATLAYKTVEKEDKIKKGQKLNNKKKESKKKSFC